MMSNLIQGVLDPLNLACHVIKLRLLILKQSADVEVFNNSNGHAAA